MKRKLYRINWIESDGSVTKGLLLMPIEQAIKVAMAMAKECEEMDVECNVFLQEVVD